jgi:predicted unusual protein kinase regulating ubiquinone biosynthesis (AarF/ABC1/UbiB family)
LDPDFSGASVLAMSYLDGTSLESLDVLPTAERDRVVTLMIDLVLRELLVFGAMQTDPNFANYRYNLRTRQIVLLDFGAVRDFAPAVAERYRALLRAGLSGDRATAARTAIDLGLFAGDMPQGQLDAVMDLFELAMAPLRHDGVFDFGATDLLARLRDGGLAIATDRDSWHVPPMDALLLQRKVGGIFLLARRLQARVRLRATLEKYL